MGGGGNLVDGVRRWLFFQRRPSSSSSSNNHDQIQNPPTVSNPEDGNNDGDLKNLTVFEDFDPSKLRQIQVPKRNHLLMEKKVDFVSILIRDF